MAIILHILKGVNIAFHTSTSLGTSLFFQTIFIAKIVAIIVVVSLTVALIED